MEKIKLSVIILSYNTKDLIKQCLDSIVEIGQNKDCEVFVVDNHSSDDSIKVIRSDYPWVQLIENKENYGFAKANNQAIKLANGDFVLLLNVDTVNTNRAIEQTLAYIESNTDIDAVTCKVELADGNLDWACHRGFPTPWASFCYFLKLDHIFPKSRLFGQYHLTYLSLSIAHEIDAPSGCFFLIRKSMIEKIGLLDEAYFFYGEDVDWSYRIKQVDGKIFYYPDAKIIHHKGIASGIKKETRTMTQASQETRIKSVNYFYDAMIIFYHKHYQKRYPFIVNWLVYVGIAIKRKISLHKLRV